MRTAGPLGLLYKTHFRLTTDKSQQKTRQLTSTAVWTWLEPEGLGLTALGECGGSAHRVLQGGGAPRSLLAPGNCLSQEARTPRGLVAEPVSGTEAGLMLQVSHTEQPCVERKSLQVSQLPLSVCGQRRMS